MTDPKGWQRTSVFAALFFFARQIRTLSQNAVQTVAPLAALLFAAEGGLMNRLLLGGVVLSIALAVTAIVQYWFFQFRITDEAILIRQGALKKKQLDIKFARIQGIHSEQNLLYRPLGLVNVSFDTAGSAASEGALPGISVALSEQLQRRVAATESERKAQDIHDGEKPQGRRVVLELGWRDMLRIGLSDRRALVAIAVVWPLYHQLGRNTQRMIESYARGALSMLEDLGITTGGAVALTIVSLTALTLAVASIAAAFLRYHNFVLTHGDARLQTVGGLLTRHTSSMDISKIQRLQFDQGVLLRLFGRWRLVFRQATSAGEQHAKSIIVPVALAQQLSMLTRLAVAPELPDVELNPRSARFQPISAKYLRPRILGLGVLPALVLALILWPHHGIYSTGAFAWTLVVGLYFFRVWRRYGYQVTDDGLVLRSGFIGYRLDAFVLRKVQRVSVHQSWWQRRSKLAGLTVYLASGTLRLRYIDAQLACRLRDRVLHAVETSQRPWF